MARYTDPVCRLCRREGMKLFLKGDRCFKDKCAIERRNYAPGPLTFTFTLRTPDSLALLAAVRDACCAA